MNGHRAVAHCRAQQFGELIHVRLEALALGVHRRVSFEQQFAVDQATFTGSLMMRTGRPTGTIGNSCATSSGTYGCSHA